MALDSNKIADNFIDQIKQGSSPIPKQDNTVIVNDDSDPSAVGGLAALGATVIGATALGRRIPGIKSFLRPFGKTPKTNTTYTPNKAVEEIGDIPTATGQSSELILAPGKELAKVGRSRIGEVQNIPFTQGKGYKDTNPLVGSATFDRVMEAPFDKGSAKKWIDWLAKGNTNLKIETGPLAGVSRRVSPDELEELNLVTLGRVMVPKLGRDKPGQRSAVDRLTEKIEAKGGFLKTMDDQNIEVDRDTLLDLIKGAPVNQLKTLRLGVRGDPEADFIQAQSAFKIAADKIPNKSVTTDELVSRINNNFRNSVETAYEQKDAIPSGVYTEIQEDLVKLGREVDNPQDFSSVLQDFNKKIGNYNQYSKKPEGVPEFLRYRRDKSGKENYYPAYKTGMGYTYKLDGGENFTEDVIFFPKRVPNVSGGRFTPQDSTHYMDNEIGFIRYDDLPNPKLGTRHIRVSEIQTDIHSPQFDADKKADYFRMKINPFNRDAEIKILKKQRDELLEKRAPYEELGRGIAGLTRSQRQELARVNYELGQLERSGMSKLAAGQQIEQTTAAPLARSWPDYAAKSMLRTMAERNINALSIVPSSMNKGIKMPGSSQLGDEINYGLMDGKAMIRTQDGALKKTNQLAANVAPFQKLAKQYGAKFEMAPMPKSNPDKPFKIIRLFSSKGRSLIENSKNGRRHYNKKIGDDYIYEDHVGAASTREEAEEILKIRLSPTRNQGSEKDYIIKEIGAENPDLYEMVPTFIASDDVLKKFLLPMKAYMYQGGFVDKTNIFKGLL